MRSSSKMFRVNNGVHRRFSGLQRYVNMFCAFVVLFGATVTPVMAQQAAPQIVVDPTAVGPHPTLEKTQNGIDQVDIAAPNRAGLSHNMFRNYNVSPNGVILNNATHNVQTKIGGAILGNANLNGHSAGVILNEVTGSLPSQIAGYTELAGQQAAVIIANPNGLTCSGCGFINTSHVTLATGRPSFDVQGAVQSFHVNGGAINFEGRGADFTTVPVLDILSRSVRIATQVNAQKANLVIGRNNVVYGSNVATPLGDDGSKNPELALDTTAMGGLYANSIYMVVNEAGAGVRVDGTMASNAGDMHLDNHGNLLLNGQMASSGQLDSSISGTTQIGAHGAMVAKESLTLNSKGDLVNAGAIAAHTGGVRLTSGNATVNSGTIASDTGPVVIHSAGRITNTGVINAQSGSGDFQADGLSNQGEMFTRDGLTVGLAHDLDNHNGIIGSVVGAVSLTGGAKYKFNNDQGKITAQSGDVTILAGAVSSNGGTIQGNGTVTATLGRYGSDAHSLFTAGRALDVTASGAVQNEGVLASGQALHVQAAGFGNGAQGQVQGQTVTVETGSGGLTNAGSLIGTSSVTLSSQGGVTNRGGQLGTSAGDVALTGTSLSNDSGKIIATNGALTVKTSGGTVLNQNGLLQADKALSLSSGDLTNTAGTLLSRQGDLTLQAGAVSSNGGTIQGNGTVTATLGRYGSDAHSLFTAGRALDVTASGAVQNEGVLASGQALHVQAAGFGNGAQGQVQGQTVTVETGSGGLTNAGSLIGTSSVTLSSQGGVTNRGGQLGTSAGDVALTGTSLSNDSGKIIATNGALTVKTSGGTVLNQNGLLQADKALSLSSGDLTNTAGTLLSRQGDLTLQAGAVSSNGGTIQGNGTVTATLGRYGSDAHSLFTAGRALDVTASGAVQNEGVLASGQALHVQAAGFGNGAQGQVQGQTVTVETGSGGLTNAGSLIGTSSVTLSSQGGVTNRGGQLGTSAGDVALTGTSLSNDSGKIIATNGALTVKTSGGTVLNQNGLLQADKALSLSSGDLTNTAGTLLSRQGDLTLQAGAVSSNGGTIQGNGTVTATLGRYGSDAHSLFTAGRALDVTASGAVQNEGVLASGQALHVQAAGFGNGAQGQVQGQTVTVETGSGGLTNAGSLIGTSSVTLSSQGGVTNRGGQLGTSAGDVALTGTSLSNDSGKIIATNGALTVKTSGGTVLNQNGLLQADKALSLSSGDLTNTAGTLLSRQGDLTFQAGAVSSNGGTIQGNGTVTATLGRYGSDAHSLFTAGRALDVTASGAVQNEGVLASGQALHMQAAGFGNGAQGQVQGQTVTVETGSGGLTNAGSLIGTSSVTLSSQGGVTNRGGQLGTSAGDVALTGTSLSNDSGKIIATNGALTVKTSGGTVLNQNGLLQADKALSLSSGDLTNTAGTLLSRQGDLTLQAGAVSSNGGTIQGNGTVTATLGRYGSDAHSLFTAGRALDVTASGAVQNEGVLASGQALHVQAAGFGNGAQGQVQGQTVTVETGSGGLTNAGSLIGTSSVTLSSQGGVTNRGGQLGTSAGDVALTGTSLSNDSGKIIATNGALTVKTSGGTVLNQNGLLQADKALSLSSGDLTNTAGTLLSRQGDLTLQAGAVSSNGGTIQGNGTVTATLGRYGSDAHSLFTAGRALDVTASGAVQNEGVLASGQALHVQAAGFGNGAQGQVQGQTVTVETGSGGLTNAGSLIGTSSVTLSSQGGVTNRGGQLGTSAGDVALTGTSLSNDSGKIIATNGALTVKTSGGTVLNQNGLLQADKALSLSSGDLTNTAGTLLSRQGDLTFQAGAVSSNGGTIQGNGTVTATLGRYGSDAHSLFTAGRALDVTASGAVQNEGVLASGQALHVQAAGFGNGAQGQVQGQTVTVETGSGGLTNAGSLIGTSSVTLSSQGGVTNRGGQLGTSAGDVALTGTSLSNDSGKIIATNGALTVKTSGGTVLNQNGLLQADKALSLSSGDLTNTAGTLLSRQGDLTLQAGAVSSNGGTIQGNGTVTATLGRYGSDAHSLFTAGRALDVTASGAVQNEGVLASGQALHMQAAGFGNGAQGQVQGQTVTVETGSGGLTNAGSLIGTSSVTLSSQGGVTNRGGQLGTSAGDVALTGTSLSNDSGKIIATNGALTVKTSGGTVLNQNGLLQADKALSLSSGDLTNTAGTLLSRQGDLTLQAGAVSSNGGTIQGNGTVTATLGRYGSDAHSLFTAGRALDVTASGAVQNEGVLASGQALHVQAAGFGNGAQGQVQGQTVTVETGSGGLTNAGSLIGTSSVTLSSQGGVTNRGGQLGTSAGDVALTGTSLSNDSGKIIATNGALTVKTSGGTVLNQNGLLQADKALSLSSGDLTNTAGTLLSRQGDLTLQAGAVSSNGGTIQGNGTVTATLGRYGSDAHSLFTAGRALDVTASGAVQNEGVLASGQALHVQAAGFGNGAQGQVQGQTVTVETGSGGLTNAGSLIGTSSVTLSSQGGVTNRGGQLGTSAGDVALTGTSLSNDSGKIIATNGALTVKTSGGTVLNQNGLLQADKALSLSSGDLTNTAGTLLSRQGDLTLQAGAVSSNGGTIQGNGTVTATLGRYGSDAHSLFTAGRALDVTASGAVQNEGVLASGQALHVQAAGFGNGAQGQVQGQTVTVETGSGGLTNAGSLIGTSSVTLSSQGGVTNRGGQLGTSAGDVALTGTSLSNDSGKIIATNGALTVKTSGGTVLNQNGLLQADKALSLSSGDLTNTAGTLLSRQGDLTLQAGAVSSNGGTIQGNGTVTATLGRYGSDAHSLFTAGRALDVTASGAVQNEGVLASGQALHVQAAGFGNGAQGQVQGQTVTVETGSGGLTNAGSLIGTSSVTLSSQGGVTNRGGQLGTSAGDVALTGTSLSNDSGKIIATNGALTVKTSGGTVLNQNGLLQADKALSLSSGDLTNTAGTLLSRQGDLTFQAGAVSSNGGTIQGNGTVTATLGRYGSDAHSLFTAGRALDVTASGAVQNEGTLGAEHDVSIQAGFLSNTGTARLLSNQGALTLQSAGTVDNQGVIRAPNGTLAIRADKDVSNQAIIAARDGVMLTTQGTVTNSGLISSVQGSLQLGIAGDLTNQNGKILNQAGPITLAAQYIDNQQGTLQSAGDVTATFQGYRSDELSSLSSQKNVTLNISGMLSNNGMIGAGKALTITGNGSVQNIGTIQTLSTQNDSVNPSLLHLNVASFTNSGTVSAAGPMLVESGAGLSNSGLLLSSKAMSLHAAGQLDNHQGRVGVQQGTLSMVADGITNDNGEILTQADDVSLKAKTVSNKEGQIQGGHGALIQADQLNNQKGSLVNQQGTFTLSTPVVLNEGGQIESDGDLKTTLNDYTSDATSRLVSQQAMTLSLPGAFDNEGVLGANEGLTVQASSLHNGARGVLMAGKGALSLTAPQGDIRNEGTIEERDRNRSEHLSGVHITNSGTILSAGNMTLASAQDVTNTATVYGAKGLTIQSGGTLNNSNGVLAGDGSGIQLTSAQLLNKAGNVRANTGTLAVQSNKVVNDNGQLSAAGNVVAQSGTLSNRHGVIQSGAGLQIGTSDAYVDNQAGILQAGRDMSLTAARVDNSNGQILGLNGGITLNNTAHGATSLANASGALKATGPVTLALTDISSDVHSIVSSVDHLTLNVASSMEENSLLSGGKGLTVTTPGLTNTGMIVSQSGPLAVTLGGAGLTNQGTIAAQGTQAQLDVSAMGALVNRHTLFSSGTMTLENQQVPSSGGVGLDNAGGKIGSSSTLTLQGAGLNNTEGMIFSDVGDLNAHVMGTMNNRGGVIQAGRGATLIASSFDNSASGVVNAGAGGLTLSAGDHGLTTLDNTGGTLQSNGGMSLATQTLNNVGGRILQQAPDSDLVIDAGGPTALTTLTKGSDGSYGLIQTQGGLQLAVDTTQGMGALIAPRDLTVTTRETDGDNFFQAGRNVTLNVLGDYTSGANGGVFALGGNASVTAHSIINQGALFAQNGAVSLQSESDIHNTGVIRSEGAMQLNLPGTLLNDEGSIVSHNGSLSIEANNGGRSAALINNSGEIRADGAQGTLLVRADTITNALVGALHSDEDKSVNPKAKDDAGVHTIKYWGRGTRTIEIPAVPGQLDDHGNQVTGYLVMHASTKTPHHNRGEGRFYTQDVTYTADHAQPVLAGAHDIMLDATGGITNYVGVVSAGHDLYLNGASLDNKAYQNARHFYVRCLDHDGCGWDSSHTSLPYIASASDPNWTPHVSHGSRDDAEPWGAIILLPGLSSMIVAGHNLVGTLSGKITNSTMIAQPGARQEKTPGVRGQASVSQPYYGFADTVGFNGSHQGYVTPTAAAQNKAVALPGFDGSIVTVTTKAGSPQPWMTPSSATSGEGNALGQATHAADGNALAPSYSGQGSLTAQGNASQIAGGTALHGGEASSALQPPSQGGLTPAQPSQAATSMTGQGALTPTGTYGQTNNGGTTLHLPPTSGDTYHNASSIQVSLPLAPSTQQGQNVRPPEVSGQTDNRGTTIHLPSSSAPSVTIPVQGGSIPTNTSQSGQNGRPTTGTATAGGHARPMSSGTGQNSPPAISQGSVSIQAPPSLSPSTHPPSSSAPSATIPAQGSAIPTNTSQSGQSSRPTAGTATAAGHAGPMSSGTGQSSPPAISQEPLATGATLHVPSADLNVIVSSIPAGKSFFVPNPSPNVHYLLETRPRYATFAGLYGSDYLLGRLGKSEQDYQFLGDRGFDTHYVQQQIVSATGQTFLGGSPQNTDQQMRDLLDHASQDANHLGLTFGQALSPEQQSKLTDNIIWYVPVSVDGHTVLAPQLYLAPGKATMRSGGEISAGNDLSLIGGSVDNSGTISAGQSLNLVATKGDIDNNGGTISGKDVSLTSLAGSINNNSLLQESQTIGGVQQNLGQQGNIIATGDARLSAAKDILFKGGNLQAGGDASLIAGGGLTLGALTAQSSENINSHHYTRQGNETKNYGSSVMAGGSATLAALGGDLTLAGSGVTAGTDALLQAKGNVALQAVTDHSYDYTRTVSHGFLSKKTITQSKDTTTENGSLIAANNNIAVMSGGNLSIAGSLEAQKNIALTSGGDLTVTALKNTEDTYYQKKKSGLFASTSGGHFTVGFQKLKQTDTTGNTGWTPSDISAGNDLSLTSHNATKVTGSTLTAGRDLSIDGSSVMFDALSQTGKQTQSSKMFSVGLSIGLSSDSVAGQALQSALAASQTSGKGSGTVKALTAAHDAYKVGDSLYRNGANALKDGQQLAQNVGLLSAPTTAAAGSATSLANGAQGAASGQGGSAGSLKLAGVEVSLGVNKSSSYAEQNQSTVQGSQASAGRDLTITARGPSDGDKAGGSIDITGAQLAAQNVALNAEKNVALKAGWDSTSTLNRSKSSSMSVGADVSVGAGVGVGISASGQMQKQNGNSDSKTAVDTVVNASQAARINAPGATELNGAEIHAKRIDVKTGQLSITSPQNISDYESKMSQASVSASGGTSLSEWSGSGGYTQQTIRDHFVSTGKTLSGLYGGSDGVGVDVAGDTTLKAGVISSTADASKNHLTTGHLDAENEENSSIWKVVSVGGQVSVGPNLLSTLAKNAFANGIGLLGGGRAHDERSVSQSVIGGNIAVQAHSASGHYLTDMKNANGALTNTFDPQELQNQLQAAEIGTQFVGEAVGELSDKLADQHVWGFGSGGYLRTALEAGGNAGVAALTGGNIGAAAASTIAGNIASSQTREWAGDIAAGLTDDPSLQKSLTNAFSNVIASGAGALGGLAAGGGHNSSINALNGAAAASAIQQYNQANEDQAEQDRRNGERNRIAEAMRGRVDYSPQARILDRAELPAGFTAQEGVREDQSTFTNEITDSEGNVYQAVTPLGDQNRALVDLQGDTVFRGPDGNYYTFYDGKRWSPELEADYSSWNMKNNSGTYQHGLHAFTDEKTHKDIYAVVRQQKMDEADLASVPSHAHANSSSEESPAPSGHSKSGQAHRRTNASSSTSDWLSGVLDNNSIGSSTHEVTEPTDSLPSILSTHAPDGANESTPEEQWINQVADSITHTVTTHGGLFLDVGSALPGPAGVPFSSAKVLWDINHGDMEGAKIDALMGALSATGLDAKALHLAGTGLSTVGKSVLHYMQTEGGIGASIVAGGSKKAEETAEKTLGKGKEPPSSGKRNPWENPDGTPIGKAGSDESKRVLDEVDDANKEGEALANQAVGEGATTKRVIPPKNGSEPGWVKESADGTRHVTYRPKGLSGTKTEDHIASVDINSKEVHSITGGKNLKIKIPEKKE